MNRIAQLRARIGALEGLASLSARPDRPAVPLGCAPIDATLPWGGLPAGGLHEIRAARPDRPAAALGFAAFCLGRVALRRPGPLVWVSQGDGLYPPGLAGVGLPTERLLLVRPVRAAELLSALEDSLRCKAVAGLLGDIAQLDFTQARRLSLAAKASGVPALLLNRGDRLGAILTRWEIASLPSASPLGVGVGAWRWRLTLERCRGLAGGDPEQAPQWQVEVKNATSGFRLAALSQHRASDQAERRHAG